MSRVEQKYPYDEENQEDKGDDVVKISNSALVARHETVRLTDKEITWDILVL